MTQRVINQFYAAIGWQELIPRTVNQHIIIDALSITVTTAGTIRLRGRTEQIRHYLLAGVPLVLPPVGQESFDDYLTGDNGVPVDLWFSTPGRVTGFVEYHLRPDISAANTANA